MAAEMAAPSWIHEQITAEEYASWSEEQCAAVEIADGMVVVSLGASKRHNRLARTLANALDAAAGPEWNADTDFDVRLQNVPLTKRAGLVAAWWRNGRSCGCRLRMWVTCTVGQDGARPEVVAGLPQIPMCSKPGEPIHDRLRLDG
ncbi:hypothetical protein GCM10010415_01750 [Streptomyces atrovirens]